MILDIEEVLTDPKDPRQNSVGRIRKWVDAALRLHEELKDLQAEISAVEASISNEVHKICGKHRHLYTCHGSNGKSITVGKPYTRHFTDIPKVVAEVPKDKLADLVIIRVYELRERYPEIYSQAVQEKVFDYRKIYYGDDEEERTS